LPPGFAGRDSKATCAHTVIVGRSSGIAIGAVRNGLRFVPVHIGVRPLRIRPPTVNHTNDHRFNMFPERHYDIGFLRLGFRETWLSGDFVATDDCYIQDEGE